MPTKATIFGSKVTTFGAEARYSLLYNNIGLLQNILNGFAQSGNIGTKVFPDRLSRKPNSFLVNLQQTLRPSIQPEDVCYNFFYNFSLSLTTSEFHFSQTAEDKLILKQ